MSATTPHVFDATAEGFETDVLKRSMETPVLLDFWAEWCGPCKTLGPILEKLADEYNGAFVLAKVDVEAQQELGAAFQIRSIPTVVLVKDGQLVDGFQGALPEGQLREFLKHHGILPGEVEPAPVVEEAPAPAAIDPMAEVTRLREAIAQEPDKVELKLDLALALLQAGEAQEAGRLLDALPANLETDDRAVRGRARLGFAALLKDAPGIDALQAAIAADENDLHARHLLGVHHIVAGRSEDGLEQFMEMLRRNKQYEDGLPRKALIDAFRVVEDADLVGQYRRKMSALLLV
ncbi:thioredoxin [Lysobacter brunescens]|uniref:Thioredoxin n=1 Tax=Lysobacter brunescens TaxID=262323 RepID=A0ABW2YEI7_9GAMM